MCKDGHSGIAWFLVVLPFIMLFVILGLAMMYQKKMYKKNKKNDKESFYV